jgi:hypothetical protein
MSAAASASRQASAVQATEEEEETSFVDLEVVTKHGITKTDVNKFKEAGFHTVLTCSSQFSKVLNESEIIMTYYFQIESCQMAPKKVLLQIKVFLYLHLRFGSLLTQPYSFYIRVSRKRNWRR